MSVVVSLKVLELFDTTKSEVVCMKQNPKMSGNGFRDGQMVQRTLLEEIRETTTYVRQRQNIW